MSCSTKRATCSATTGWRPKQEGLAPPANPSRGNLSRVCVRQTSVRAQGSNPPRWPHPLWSPLSRVCQLVSCPCNGPPRTKRARTRRRIFDLVNAMRRLRRARDQSHAGPTRADHRACLAATPDQVLAVARQNKAQGRSRTHAHRVKMADLDNTSRSSDATLGHLLSGGSYLAA